MSTIPLRDWDLLQIKQFEEETGQALVLDEPTLALFSQDFGKLVHSQPAAISIPKNTQELIKLIQFAYQHHLPLTIRGNGLSQCGQSLANHGGLCISMSQFTDTLDMQEDSIWVEANCTWASLLEQSLQNQRIPWALPYNCNLSVAGVLSAGGIGASSFKYGSVNAHVEALEVIDGTGHLQHVDASHPLFKACLSGQGRCGVITKAQIKLRPAKKHVKTFCLVYADFNHWFADIERVKAKADYLELFCSPSIQGVRLADSKRVPTAQWLYGMHLSLEYDELAPKIEDLGIRLQYLNLLNSLEESLSSYLLRHNPRFEMMKLLGQWELYHPWYECFVPTEVLKVHLPQLLQELPIHYANLVHVVPIAPNKAPFLMFPESDSVCELMILHPGVQGALKDSCLQVGQELDDKLMQLGSKRYLSGYIGQNLSEDYWQQHFGEQHAVWVDLKRQFDPAGIFTSVLHKA